MPALEINGTLAKLILTDLDKLLRQKIRQSLSLCFIIMLSGCGLVPQSFQLAAAQLEAVPTSIPNKMDEVHDMVQNSQSSCAAFVNSLYAESAGSGTVLDVLSTGTSALATVFTPLAVTHSLSAASTIFSSTKTSISSNYLNTLAISHIAQAIQTNYSADMQRYISHLSTVDPNTIDPYAERSQILSYHNECSLASAEGSISSTLQTANNSGSTTPIQTNGFSYTIPSKPILDTVAKDFVSKFNLNPDFKAAGVVASTTATPGVISFQMTTTSPLNSSVTPSDHTETANIDNNVTPSTLTIGGTLRAGDIIYLTQSQQPQPAAVPAPAPAPTPAPTNHLEGNTLSQPTAEPPAGLLGRPAGGTSELLQ